MRVCAPALIELPPPVMRRRAHVREFLCGLYGATCYCRAIVQDVHTALPNPAPRHCAHMYMGPDSELASELAGTSTGMRTPTPPGVLQCGSFRFARSFAHSL